MGQEEDLELYRSRLLESLNGRSSRYLRDASDPIQVYVNERRVGELEGTGIGAMLRVQCVDHIDTVQLRTEEGTLLGGLVAPEHGFRTDRLRLSFDAIELCVHNTAQGGMLSALFIPAPGFWSRAWKSIAETVDRLVPHRLDAALAYGMRSVAFTQALLAVAVVGLVADRVTTWTWMTPEPTPSPVVQTPSLPASPPVETARLGQQLDEVARIQAKIGEALASQQNGIVQLHQAVAKLSSTQESVVSSVVMVKEEVKEELEKRLEAVGREADRTTRHVASKGRVEQEQLEAAIHSLTADNDRLSKEVAGLEENNQALKTKLQAANASKAVDPNPDRLLARQTDASRQPLQLADSLPGSQQQPFLFWVTFSEGTSQESIDQWVNGMKGHKGAVNEGWQEVRIVPPPVPPDRFLEQIRGEKIVKAARISQ